jgi:dolichol kinase
MDAHAISKRAANRAVGRPPLQAIWNAPSASTSPASQEIAPQVDGFGSGLVLDSREVARKLWHMTPGVLIMGLPLVRDLPLVAHHLAALIVIFTAILAMLSLVHAKRFMRPRERDWSVSVWAFAATAIVPLIAFPGHVELALTALVILAFGDGAAALGGLALRGPTLPWNENKTIAGTLSFIICAAPCATWIYWGISNPRVPFEIALISGVAAASVAAVAESVRSSVNDNIRVGVAATSMLLLLCWMIP